MNREEAVEAGFVPLAPSEDDGQEVERLRAEVKRHRDANLLRAVFEGYGPVDEFITEAINAQDFDRVPWIIAEKWQVKYQRLKAQVEGQADA